MADNPFIFPKQPLIKTLEFKYSVQDHAKLEWKAAKNKQVYDAILRIEEQEYAVSKCKLNVHSSYFSQFFTEGSTPPKSVYRMPEEKHLPMKRMLKFIYVGALTDKQLGNFEQTVSILKIATRYGVEKLVECCGMRIQQKLENDTLTPSDLEDLLIFGLEYILEYPETSKQLIRVCFRQIELNPSSIDLIVKVVKPENFNIFQEIVKESRFVNIEKELQLCLKYNPSLKKDTIVEKKLLN